MAAFGLCSELCLTASTLLSDLPQALCFTNQTYSSSNVRKIAYVIRKNSCYRKLLIRMTSLLSLPRVSASCLPSCDQSKSKICPDSKFVICFGGPPPSFCRQMLETPFLVNTYSTASPAGAQRGALC